MTILDLLNSDGFQPKKIASTNGGEYAGVCPFCGGEDRFRVWPNHNGGRYWCRQCEKTGDTVDYLMNYRRINYNEACAVAGIRPRQVASICKTRPSASTRQGEKSIGTPLLKHNRNELPTDIWREKAGNLLSSSEEGILGIPDDPDDFLYDGFMQADGIIFPPCQALRSRGLSITTITNAHLGWCGFQIKDSRLNWGLPTQEGRTTLIIPAGLIIPTYNIQGQLIRIRIRRKQIYKDTRYYLLPGSSSSPMILLGGDGKVVVIVESELDALLIKQVAGDIVTTIALGSAAIKPDIMADAILQRSDLVLHALDGDAAGAKTLPFWKTIYGTKVKRWPVPVGKDPSEAWANGLDIRAWVMAGLSEEQPPEVPRNAAGKAIEATPEEEIDNGEGIPFPSEWSQRFSEQQIERLAIMTVDGRMSDEEAMSAIQQ